MNKILDDQDDFSYGPSDCHVKQETVGYNLGCPHQDEGEEMKF